MENVPVAPLPGASRREEDQTHSAECWRDPKHHACAVRKVEELQRLSDSQEEALQMMERGSL